MRTQELHHTADTVRPSELQQAEQLINDYQPVPEFCERFPHIPKKTILWQLTQRHKNGLAPHVRLIGKQRYISISGYAEWLANGAQG